MTGKVYLTGSGPGDEKLLTLKAAEALADCSAVVYDYLSSHVNLEKYAPRAEKFYVGKRGHHHATEQKEINSLLIKLAREGKKVVRLKGGDPFVFGRGGEEALALVQAGVEYEVIPGVSSVYSVPAFAGIPVTQRGYTSSLAVVTGQEGLKERTDINWKSLAQSFGTIVFLMGVKNLALIVEKLEKYGKSKDTPVALIRWGTTVRQEVIEGTLSDIVKQVSLTNFAPPAIIVIGGVVSLRKQLKWFEKKPLFGKTVVVTRNSDQASKLVQAFNDLGARVIELPTIKVMPADSYKQLDEAIERQRPNQYYDWLIFTSANGVRFLNSRLKTKNLDFRIFKGAKIAAVGPATAQALESLSIAVDILPKEYKGEGLLDALGDVKGKKILIPRAKVARELLPQELSKAGAKVDVVEAYLTIMDTESAKKAAELNGKVDVITFTSSSSVSNFVEMLGGKNDELLSGAKVAVIGPVTANTAQEKGMKVDVTAKKYTIDGLVEAVVNLVKSS